MVDQLSPNASGRLAPDPEADLAMRTLGQGSFRAAERHLLGEHPAGAGPTGADAAQRKIWLFYLISYPLWAAAALRAISDTWSPQGPPSILVAPLLAYAVLLGTERALTGRVPWYPHLVFAAQSGLILLLILRLPDLDYFATLFIPLTAQAMLALPEPAGNRWTVLFTLVMAGGLLISQGWPESLPFILLYAGAYVFVARYAALTAEAETARERSRALLSDLQDAYRRLETYASQVEELAVVEERNRLARDLHDSVTQTLYGLTLSAEAASRTLARGDAEAAAAHLGEVRETARHALGEMRLLIFELRPALLAQEGLAASLRARLDAVEGRAGLAATFAVEGGDRLPAATEAELDRIAQEALNNALKHAHACRIDVHLRQDGSTVALEIVDDGVGFDPNGAASRGGLGLRGMAERAARLGGRLTIDSLSGAGTRVKVEAPR